jgi:hypothetical protein
METPNLAHRRRYHAPVEWHQGDGIDDTLIAWMLSLTPDQRLDILDNYLQEIEEIRQENASR